VADAGGGWSGRPAPPRGRRAAAHPARASGSLEAEPASTAAWSRCGRSGATNSSSRGRATAPGSHRSTGRRPSSS